MNLSHQRILVCILTAIIFLQADALAQKKRGFTVIIENKSGTLSKGKLGSISTTGIDIVQDSTGHTVVSREDVANIRFRRDGRIKRHMIWGGVLGAAAGIIISAVTYEGHPCGSGFQLCSTGVGPVTGFLSGAITGVGIGALLGARYKEIELTGDPKKYDATILFFENPDPKLEKDLIKNPVPKP